MDFGGGLQNLAELNLAPSNSEMIIIAAASGTKIEVIKFLNEVVLRLPEGALWLSSKLAIARKLRILRKLKFQQPRIWLLTGLYTMADARVVSSSERGRSAGGMASVPIPDPSGITALLEIMPQLSMHIESNRKLEGGAQILGTKIYAAQYQQLDVKYIAIEDGRNTLPNQVNLLNIFSAQEHRGEAQVAEICIAVEPSGEESDEVDATNDSIYDAEFDDGYWEAFKTELVEVKAELEE
ncbi:hypothetical protein MMC25_000806 [Agyrium rufum]|nr:hypothetical protein [Agyrium rufum]